MPVKSSLKSPEKDTAPEVRSFCSIAQIKKIYSFNQQPQAKERRHVAFKVQRYHSVYEYPSEVVQLSPAWSEPKLWSNYLDDFSGNIDYFAYANQLSDNSGAFDGFNISSSSRPFYNINSQLHNTWPNENTTDFSWSQLQVNIFYLKLFFHQKN